MLAETDHCRNHPDTAARRRCYQCLAAICPRCQTRAMGHIFCSLRCRVRYWAGERAAGASRLAWSLVRPFRRLEKALDKATGSGIMRLVTIGLLLVIMAQVMVLVAGMSHLEQPAPVPVVTRRPPTMEIIPGDKYITVAGSAPGFAVAVLSADGSEIDTCRVTEGYYSFTFQPGEDARTVQVQVYGDQVPTMFSKAYPVPQPAAGAALTKERKAAVRNLPAAGPRQPDSVEGRASGKKAAARNRPATASGAVTSPAVQVDRNLLSDLSRGAGGRRRVAITFDGGSFNGVTGKILRVLRDRRLTATFFLTGEFMKRYPEATRDIVADGHEVGNHTFTHLHLTTYARNYRQDTLPGITRDLLVGELKRNEKLFAKITGDRMIKLWRAPYGEQNRQIRGWAAGAGYRHVSWTIDPKTRQSLDALDWVSDTDSTLYLSSDEIVKKLLAFDASTSSGMDGGIMLMHLGSEREDQLYAKLGRLIDEIQERGYEIGPVTRLLGDGG